METVEGALKIGIEAGFSAGDAYLLKQQGHQFHWLSGGFDDHESEIVWLAARFFRDHGDPAGFALSRPDARSVRSRVADLQSNLPVDRKKNWRDRLPTQPPGTRRMAIVDPDYESIGGAYARDELERIREALVAFPGVHLRDFTFQKQLRRVYLANSTGYFAKYRKTLFHWRLGLESRARDGGIEVNESHVSPVQYAPERTVARACNLLRSLSGAEEDPPRMMIFAPEAVTGLLRDFADELRLDRTNWTCRQTVAASVVTIIDSPLLEGQSGSVPFDDEGVAGGETRIISKGVFLEPVSDIRCSFEKGRTGTGNGFRDERSIFPLPHFSNLFVRPAAHSLTQLMAQAGAGALVTLLRPAGRDPASGDSVYTAFGYHFSGDDIQRPLSFRFRTSARSFWMHVGQVSKELRFLHGRYNIGSPYLLAEASRRGNGLPAV